MLVSLVLLVTKSFTAHWQVGDQGARADGRSEPAGHYDSEDELADLMLDPITMEV